MFLWLSPVSAPYQLSSLLSRLLLASFSFTIELNSYLCIRLCKLTVWNFISGVPCHKLNLWLFVQDPHINWSTLNSSWTVTHKEYCAFGSKELQYRCDQMGRTLLIDHSVISWSTGDILKWREQCFPELPVPRLPKNSEPAISMELCTTSIKSPIKQLSMEIYPCYSHFQEVFCPQQATQLTPHRLWDGAIDLLPGELIILFLSKRPWLYQSIIKVAFTSPGALSFFWCKDGRRLAALDYRSLIKITVKFCYSLPLLLAALELLWGATIFIKLNLHSALNLIWIQSEDKWKTAFVSPKGHYEYRVMPYGLVNAPSVFQEFMNEVFWEYLHKFILVYINDILVYSQNLAEHRHHVALLLSKLREYHLKAEKYSFH